MGRKHCGKMRKYWLPAFSHFPTMFSKALFFIIVETQDLVKGYTNFLIQGQITRTVLVRLVPL